MNEIKKTPKISIVLPCLNEAVALPTCLDKLYSLRSLLGDFEIIFVDNNSDDGSGEIIKSWMPKFPEIKLVKERRRGYGFAYLAGFSYSLGDYVFMADADASYDFSEIPKFISILESGADLVIGNRFSGKMDNKSMPFLHRYIGNPFLSFLVRLFFKARVKDVHCGARAIKRNVFNKLDLRTGGMEFASEMIIKAVKLGLIIKEVPISYYPRLGESKLNSFQDGWRHLRFIMLNSPLFLFFIPGVFLFLIGLFGAFIFYFFQPKIFGIAFDYHPFFVFAAAILIGYQLIIFALFSKIYAINHLGDRNKFIESFFGKLTIERVAPIGLIIFIFGLLIFLLIFINWIKNDFNSLMQVKNSILALIFSVIGCETLFSAFMFSILGIKRK